MMPDRNEAVRERMQVSVRFYFQAVSCVPIRHAPGAVQDGPNRAGRCDDASNTGPPAPGLVPKQMAGVPVPGAGFDPAEFTTKPSLVSG